jgi:hypothetical protein
MKTGAARSHKLSSKLIGAALIVLVTAVSLNATAFCYSRGRYISQQERFENAILHQASEMGDFYPGETARFYLERHPDCCSICERVPPDQSFLNYILGYKLRYFRVAYPLKQAQLDQFPKGGVYYEAFVEITPCGGTLHSTGMRVDERPGRC